MRKSSPKGKARKALYYELRAPFISANPVCQICNSAPATDCHHRKGRRGKLLFDQAWWMSLCNDCHINKVHGNVKWAKEMGYLVPFWK